MLTLPTAFMIAASFSGCVHDAGPKSHEGVKSSLAHDKEISQAEVYLVGQDFNLGSMLAKGQTVEHHFRMVNRTDSPIRILGVEPYTPCCSTVGDFPKVIPAKFAADIPVGLKVDNQSGIRRFTYAIHTDYAEKPIWHATLQAEFHPSVVATILDGSTKNININDTGCFKFELVRSFEATALVSRLAAVESDNGYLNFVIHDNQNQLKEHGSIVSMIQNVDILLPESRQTGERSIDIRFVWEDGHSMKRRITWRIKPSIKAAPSALIINRKLGFQSAKASLSSSDRPFRVIGLAGEAQFDIVPKLPTDFGREHDLEIILKSDIGTPTKIADVKLILDHPVQKNITLSVLVISDGGEG